MARIVVVGDLHGNIPLISAPYFDYIIAPGDFCSDKLRKFMFKAMHRRIQDPNYKKDWTSLIGYSKAKKGIQLSLKDGRKVVKDLNRYNKPAYIVPGNWDWFKQANSKVGFLRKNNYLSIFKDFKNIQDCHIKLLENKDFCIIGYGLSTAPEYPQGKESLANFKKIELKKMKNEYHLIFKKLSRLFIQAKRKNKPIIFLSHNVPFNTKLDKILNKESPKYGKHSGSLIAREIIEKYQPDLCIGGHMHEHFGRDKIQKTNIINSGFGPYVNVIIDIQKNKIKQIKFLKLRRK